MIIKLNEKNKKLNIRQLKYVHIRTLGNNRVGRNKNLSPNTPKNPCLTQVV
jgi:hypothetical protein